jgi:hypothetical protein
VEIDRLVTWDVLTGGDRLSKALALCEERGWGALPLAPKELNRLAPGVWPTEKSAEMWLKKSPEIKDLLALLKNPPLSNIKAISAGRVLVDYRPKGQTSWSRALVREGLAPAAALAHVLGVRQSELRWRFSDLGAGGKRKEAA